MVETRDLLIADLHREIEILKHGLDMAINLSNSPTGMRDGVECHMRKKRNAPYQLSRPCDTCGSTLHYSDVCGREFSVAP